MQLAGEMGGMILNQFRGRRKSVMISAVPISASVRPGFFTGPVDKLIP